MEYISLIKKEAKITIFPDISDKRSKWKTLLMIGKSIIKFEKLKKIKKRISPIITAVSIGIFMPYSKHLSKYSTIQ